MVRKNVFRKLLNLIYIQFRNQIYITFSPLIINILTIYATVLEPEELKGEDERRA